ncbi:MAG: 4Fe-4S binding protein [Bacteroidaceae bacterium]|nr:4Fe-4S binding protein [Bacteroidaceae bacterium]
MVKQLLCLAACILMVAGAALRRNAAATSAEAAPVAGTVNTSSLGAVAGYAGPVPLQIYVSNGVVDSVIALPNVETPDFFSRAAELLHRWDGLTVEEAARLHVDAVSGATYTSMAIIDNMQRGMKELGANNQQKIEEGDKNTGIGQASAANDQWLKYIAGLIVALMAAFIPLFWKNRVYRVVQQLLNVAVLGFWCGACLSYSSLLGLFNVQWSMLNVPWPTVLLLVLLIVAIVWPLFGRKSHYCNHVCPFGSLQELCGRCMPYKLRLSSRTVKSLNLFRRILWALLMLCLWTGVWFEWVDYEPFSAFIVQSASAAILIIAAFFVILSLFVSRPYCRFVCPLGTLLKISQGTEITRKKKE